MVDLQDVLRRVKDRIPGRPAEVDPREAVELDGVTTDKVLRALRRQDRVNGERDEKIRLRARIAADQLRVDRDMIVGASPLRQKQSFFDRGINGQQIGKRVGSGKPFRQEFFGKYKV